LAKKPDDRPSMLSVAHALESVRDELARRKKPLAAPIEPVVIEPRAERLRTAPPAPPELAATQLATTRHSRGWRIAAGALALVSAAAMFGLARDSDATAAQRVGASLVHVRTAGATPLAVAAPAAAALPAPAPAAVIPVTPVKAPVTISPSVPHPATRPTAHPAARHAPKLRVLATPHSHESGKLDPDGTVDPYS
jgi:hypothetical protein